MPPLVAEERGQALVIVGAAMAVLIAALALSAEWGYGFTQRRAAQNDADASALAVGRQLASTFVSAGRPFGATVDQLCETARAYRNASAGEILTLSFADALGNPTGGSVATNACATRTGDRVAGSAVFVRVSASRIYPSVFGGAVGRATMTAGASARARLTAGALLHPLQLPPDPGCAGCAPGNGVSALTTAPSVAIWPIVRYFEPSEFAGAPCGAFCDRSAVAMKPIRLIQRGGPSSTFRGLITPTHDTTRGGSARSNQAITESDWSGTTPGIHGHPSTAPLATHGENGCSPLWNSMGSTDISTAGRCDVPNWFWYGYRGSFSLDTDFTSSAAGNWRSYLDSRWVPQSLPLGAARHSCVGVPAYFPTPSCGAQVGDWVETLNGTVVCGDDSDCQDDVQNFGDLTPTMVANIHHFIAQYGRELPNSGGVKAVVVNVFLWDCADSFSANTWTRASNSSCDPIDPITASSVLRHIARVHLVTVVPFTVYDDGVTNDHVDAYWGNAFGEAGSCQQNANWNANTCQLNPLMNSAFLVPDE